MNEAILSLDIGTTVAKGVLFDLSGKELRVVERNLQLYTPQPGWVEMEPEQAWDAVLQVLCTLSKESQPTTHILAVALSTQGGSLIPVKEDGVPTNNLIT